MQLDTTKDWIHQQVAIIPPHKPFQKLQAQSGMAPNTKVGSWLANNKGKANGTEAYESSDSGSSSDHRGSVSDSDEEVEVVKEEKVVRPPAPKARPPPTREVLEDEDEDDDEAEEAEEVDWEKTIPRIRLALVDPSDLRRREFIQRHLSVTEACKYWLLNQQPRLTASAPPNEQVPAIIKSILQALPALSDIHGIDDTVQVLSSLIKRDEKQSSEKLKLGMKLVKWVSMEVDTVIASAKT